jgi:hypothetical protein
VVVVEVVVVEVAAGVVAGAVAVEVAAAAASLGDDAAGAKFFPAIERANKKLGQK